MQAVKDVSKITPFDTIYIHKDWREWFLSLFKDDPEYGVYRPYKINPLYGFDINFVDHVPKFAKQWVFPVTRFVEYEESDEAWARPIGFGYEVDTDVPAIWMVNHRAIWSADYMFNPFTILSKNYY